MIEYRSAHPSTIKAPELSHQALYVSEKKEITCDIGTCAAVALYDQSKPLAALLVIFASAREFGEQVEQLLDKSLAQIKARGARTERLDVAVFGGSDALRWQTDRLMRILKSRSLSGRKLDDVGGRDRRKLTFSPRTGRLSVAKGGSERVQLNPASTSLSAQDGGKHFSESMVDGVVANATRFFRLEQTFRGLRKQVVPEFIAEGRRRPFTLWSAACSSGEEPYSYAMYLLRLRERAGGNFPVSIFATDINGDRLALARRGSYSISRDAVQDYSAYFRRYGMLDGQNFTVGPEVRSLVKFGRFDLMHPPRKHRFRMIVCANVFQYYNNDARRHFFANFLSVLERPGYIYANSLRREVIEEFGCTYLPEYRLIRAD